MDYARARRSRRRRDEESLSYGDECWVINAIGSGQKLNCQAELLSDVVERVTRLNGVIARNWFGGAAESLLANRAGHLL